MSVALQTSISCNHHHHPSSELFSSCKAKILSPLNTNSPFPLLPAPGNQGWWMGWKSHISGDSQLILPRTKRKSRRTPSNLPLKTSISRQYFHGHLRRVCGWGPYYCTQVLKLKQEGDWLNTELFSFASFYDFRIGTDRPKSLPFFHWYLSKIFDLWRREQREL